MKKLNLSLIIMLPLFMFAPISQERQKFLRYQENLVREIYAVDMHPDVREELFQYILEMEPGCRFDTSLIDNCKIPEKTLVQRIITYEPPAEVNRFQDFMGSRSYEMKRALRRIKALWRARNFKRRDIQNIQNNLNILLTVFQEGMVHVPSNCTEIFDEFTAAITQLQEYCGGNLRYVQINRDNFVKQLKDIRLKCRDYIGRADILPWFIWSLQFYTESLIEAFDG